MTQSPRRSLAHSTLDNQITVYTVGHSTHALDSFVALLKQHDITALGDVRSKPYSRYNPQYNRESLERSLKSHDITYVYLGAELGGQPDDPSCYANGRVQYSLVATKPYFQRGLERVCTGASQYRLALMCAEKEPGHCHRTLLVSHNLAAQGVNVRHILADGALETHQSVHQRVFGGLDLS